MTDPLTLPLPHPPPRSVTLSISYLPSSSFQASTSHSSLLQSNPQSQQPLSPSSPSASLAPSATLGALSGDQQDGSYPSHSSVQMPAVSLVSDTSSSSPHRITQHPGNTPVVGQSHSHRPVSAMPTPSGYSQRATMAQSGNTDDVLNSMSGVYNDRRASAHPTMPTTSQTVQGLAQMAISPSIDASMASNAISSGIPITSQAAMQYFAAHPRRQQVHFGNYLLLQTLGEGEFGKVKLGVHKEWGEEVAVKLIKREKVGGENGQLNIGRGAPPKDPAKMSKVEREIQVLKEMRHPNIVRLYEVIESDRYIGIVLEYASGGELFDHILAHKYLKDRDACRLFAQLVSGVNYLHQKKVVHRDLKLENLLLDRNRNVIITDFGFANNFADRSDDLMATSCGSPCYAAPELVVQDGLYNGTAVDVWSCGVILYAMLAGYLPFDDDPANPEGDNINLLYKYIMATPLSFPDYITAEPRDLLLQMLVPDPAKRIDLRGVMAHSWLEPYRDLFKFTVEELERAAVEQQTKKRQVYRQQMDLQHQMRERQRQEAVLASQRPDSRSRSNVGMPASSVSMASGLVPQSVKAQRHQSATATIPFTESQSSRTSMGPPAAPSHLPLSDTTNLNRDHVTALGDARGEPRIRRDEGDMLEFLQDDRGSFEGHFTKGPAASKTQRHTIQLEYDGGAAAAARQDENISTPRSTSIAKTARENVFTPAHPAQSNTHPAQSNTRRVVSSIEAEIPALVPAVPILVPEAEAITAQRTTSQSGITSQGRVEHESALSEKSADYQRPAGSRQSSQSTPKISADTPATVPLQGRESSSSRVASRVPSSSAASATQLRESGNEATSPSLATQQGSSTDTAASARSKRSSTIVAAPPVSSNADRTKASRRHSKGFSTDKFSLARLLGSNSNNSVGTATPGIDSRTSVSATPAVHTANADRPTRASELGRAGSSRRKAMSLVVGGPNSSVGDSASKDRDRANAAVARTSKVERQDSVKQTSSGNGVTALPERMSSRSGTQQAPSSSARVGVGRTAGQTGNQAAPFQFKANDSISTVGPSSSAAKKVMDWFRRKSLGGRNAYLAEAPALASPTSEKEKRPAGAPASATVLAAKPRPATSSAVDANPAPKLTVTEADNEGHSRPIVHQAALTPSEAEGVPSSRSTSGAYSNVSHSSAATGITSATESSYVNVNGAMLPPSTSSSKMKAQQPAPTPQEITPRPSYTAPSPSRTTTPIFNENLLRYHVGAVDQSALTSRPPPEIFADVCRALCEMGIEARQETGEEFKLECVRRKKAGKTLMGATQGLGTSLRSSVFPPTQSDYERHSGSGLSRSSTLTAAGVGGHSPASTSMSPSQSSLRNFLRRPSQAVSPTFSTIALPDSHSSSAMEPSTSQQSTMSSSAVLQQQRTGSDPLPPTLYGEARVDGGQEVRFSVEVTRIKNLAGLYSLDVRRLRGPLTSYKFLYYNVLKRVTDPSIDQ